MPGMVGIYSVLSKFNATLWLLACYHRTPQLGKVCLTPPLHQSTALCCILPLRKVNLVSKQSRPERQSLKWMPGFQCDMGIHWEVEGCFGSGFQRSLKGCSGFWGGASVLWLKAFNKILKKCLGKSCLIFFFGTEYDSQEGEGLRVLAGARYGVQKGFPHLSTWRCCVG